MDNLDSRMINERLNYSKAMIKQIDHVLGDDEQFTNMKALAFAGFLDYYGESHINDIYAAFLQTKFIGCDSSIADLVKEKFGLSRDVADTLSKHAPGTIYNSTASYDEKSHKYSFNRTIYVWSSGDLDSYRLLRSIVHQMNHVFNSIQNPVVNKTIDGLCARMGASTDCFSSRVERNLFFEEAINQLQIDDIMGRIMYFSQGQIDDNDLASLIGDILKNSRSEDNNLGVELLRPLYQDSSFRNVVVDRRISGKLSGIGDEFDSKTRLGSYRRLLFLFDRLSEENFGDSAKLDEAKTLVKRYTDRQKGQINNII